MIRVCATILAMLMAMSGAAEPVKMKAILTVPHEFDMLVKSGHIQGLACSEKGIYLSHQTGLAKLGWDGKLVKHIEVPGHLGGIACANGRLYGAFIIRKPKDMKDGKPGLLRIWDEDLSGWTRQETAPSMQRQAAEPRPRRARRPDVQLRLRHQVRNTGDRDGRQVPHLRELRRRFARQPGVHVLQEIEMSVLCGRSRTRPEVDCEARDARVLGCARARRQHEGLAQGSREQSAAPAPRVLRIRRRDVHQHNGDARRRADN